MNFWQSSNRDPPSHGRFHHNWSAAPRLCNGRSGITPSWATRIRVSPDTLSKVYATALGLASAIPHIAAPDHDGTSNRPLSTLKSSGTISLGNVRWGGSLGPSPPHCFVDSVLPFGLRSAPKIFTALADALEWVVRRAGVETLLHYLDDFLIVVLPASEQCSEDLRKLLHVFARLRIPVAMEKLEGPTTRLTFLGIELDTHLMVLRLPQEKLRELRTLLAQWCTWRYCHTRDLQLLVGKLQHACKVVRPGRTFLRRMFELLKGTRRHQPFIRLNAAFRSNLTWWHSFLEHWNGISMLDGSLNKPPDHHLFTDASGGLGCGAWAGRHWFQYFWPEEITDRSIAVKELLPIVLACIV